ncbi:LOW QUALITY PROTEIN: hypothetical protein PHPALM_30732 [Phytophthora palmivora]|uniref:HAT C-terminal dimerisation domain-containing protein n=1 Tax=Phytophthora palmivora TaxID=4796 RepID=A0A2P4X4E7_9STRA|nr:LOW QUALITY PROTEIN: hypothetical protein PHPALM_30732 [Phytophthora palmivora]
MLPRDFASTSINVFSCVNKLLAMLVGVSLVECASHRLNRAVQDDLRNHESDLAEVHTLMIKLRTLTQSAKLRIKTTLRPVIRQDTRWSFSFAMLHRYFKLLEHIDKEDDDIADVIPGPACNRRLLTLLKDVEYVSKALQGSADMQDVREWFDALLPLSRNSLTIWAQVLIYPDFESGCVRVLHGNTYRHTQAEKAVLQPFAVTDTVVPILDEEQSSSFVVRLQKRRKIASRVQKYTLVRSIPPTSIIVERFFSIVRTTFGQERNSLHPATLEQILVLHQNVSYWDVGIVDCFHNGQILLVDPTYLEVV